MAFSNGKKYGQPISTCRKGACKKALVQAVVLTPHEFVLVDEQKDGSGQVISPAIMAMLPGNDQVFVRTRGAKSIVGGHNGMKPWDLGWADRRTRIRERMGRQDVWDQFFESIEVETEPVVSEFAPFCSGIALRDFHDELDEDLEIDVYWVRYEQMFEDETESDDAEIIELMGAEYLDIEDPIGYNPDFRGYDLADNFDDEGWENPLGMLLN